jgi:ferric-dicitrate binding protein FerR (iron transport regulator)
MGFGRRTSRHVEREVLHAYSAGELDPAHRVVVERHLEACGRCSAALAEADALRAVLVASEPPPLDDLAWQRMQRRVRAELESRASSSAMRGRSAREWLGAALASAAAAVALVVWFTPFTPSAPVGGPRVGASDERLELVVGRGVVVRADRGARMRVVDVDPSAVRLALDEGRIAVRMTPELDTALALEARGGVLEARGAMFTLSALGARAELDVGRGQVQLTQGGARRTMHDGQLWGWSETGAGPFAAARPGASAFESIEASDPGADAAAVRAPESSVSGDAPAARAPMADAVEPRSVDTALGPTRAAERASATERPGSSPSARRSIRAPSGAASVVPGASRGGQGAPSLAVAASGPASLDARGVFEAAQQAFDEGEVTRALELARAVPRDDDLWAQRAAVLECRAAILVGEHGRAVEACERVLRGELEPVERRHAHLMLAQLHRTQLGDCGRALPHFDAASVRGENSLLQEEVLLGRCDCRIRVGNLDGATRDVAQLELRGNALTRPRMLEALRLELQKARAAEGLR